MKKLYSKVAKFTPDYLKTFCEENNLKCVFKETTTKIKRESRIIGECIADDCNNNFETDFRSLVEKKLFYCKSCLLPQTKQKRENTLLKTTGYKSAGQNPITKEKTKKTNNVRYGGDTPMSSEKVREQVKQTTFDNHGVYFSSQNKDVQKKMKEGQLKNKGIDHFEFSDKSLFQMTKDQNIVLLDDNYNEINEDNCDYYENITRNDSIYYKCVHPECSKDSCKNYRQLKEVSGAYCEEHTKITQFNKRVETCMDTYGYKSPSQCPYVKAKQEATMIKLHGVTHIMKIPEICQQAQIKKEQTNLERYNVKHAMQCSEIAEKASKNARKVKPYIFPSGRIDMVQGYEPQELDYLLNVENISEEDIVTDRTQVPECWWYDENGKIHRYYVDIYILSQQRCIEVKSRWSFGLNPEIIFTKQRALQDAGYSCEICVLNKKGVLLDKFM